MKDENGLECPRSAVFGGHFGEIIFDSDDDFKASSQEVLCLLVVSCGDIPYGEEPFALISLIIKQNKKNSSG